MVQSANAASVLRGIFSVPFINFMLLERVSEWKASVLDVRIKMDTIQQFLTFNLSEEYSYPPSSLSFGED